MNVKNLECLLSDVLVGPKICIRRKNHLCFALTPTQEKLVIKIGTARFKISIASSSTVWPLSVVVDDFFESPSSTSTSDLSFGIKGCDSVASLDMMVVVVVVVDDVVVVRAIVFYRSFCSVK